jgi:soluble epoxide hydrolase/lipid-phosphate phosphatase
MDSLEKKTISVSRSLTYTYYTSLARDSLPTCLLVHGWPDTAELWSDLITNHLQPAGYGVVAIDCLGYGGTSKPTDYQSYNFQRMSQDVVDILNNEKLDKVISLGHDWGCGLSQRVYNYHPDRVSGVVLVNVAYLAPTPEPFDLDQTLELTSQFFGYGTYVSCPALS